jgi:hypothetical protein
MMAKLDQPAPLETKPPSVRENQGSSQVGVLRNATLMAP